MHQTIQVTDHKARSSAGQQWGGRFPQTENVVGGTQSEIIAH